MLIWSREAFISGLGLSLLHSLWQGALIGLVGIALRFAMRRAPVNLRHNTFCLLLLTLFVAWLGSFGCLYARALLTVSDCPVNGPACPHRWRHPPPRQGFGDN